MAKTRGTVDPQHEAEFDANPWTRRVRHHMRLNAGSPVVYKRITPRLGA